MNISLYVATPCFGNVVTADYMIDVMNLDYACQELGIGFDLRLIGDLPMLPLARSTCVKHFLESDFTHMLFVDADVSFTHVQAKRLLDSGKDFCCTPYPKKTVNWNELVGKQFDTVKEIEKETLAFTYNPKPGAEVDDNGFVEVETAATGFMLLKRNVLEEMINAYPELKFRPNYKANDAWADGDNLYALFDPIIDSETHEYHGDDNAFCKRWTEIGGSIYLDTMRTVTHIGRHYFGRNI